MLFVLEDNCFSEEANTLTLLALAKIVLDARHRIYAEENGAEYKKWFGTLQNALKDDWQLALDSSLQREALEPARHRYVVSEGGAGDVDVRQAYEAARVPFLVFVENDNADREFLLSFAEESERQWLTELERLEFLRFDHCGGITQIPVRLKRHLKRGPTHKLNTYAVFDSDALKPETPSENTKRTKKCCEKEDIPFHMLEKRAIENYLALDWLHGWTYSKRATSKTRGPVFEAFCQLTEEQRSHFNMKRGHGGDEANSDWSLDSLFGDVDEKMNTALKNGFGEDVASLYSKSYIQSDPVIGRDCWVEVNGVVKDIVALTR